MISYKFSFLLRTDEADTIGWKILHRQLILIDDIPGWPAINVCGTFRNTMLTEIGKIMITPFPGVEHDRSPSVIGEQFLRTMWLYFLPLSLDFNLTEYINRKIRRPRRGCQENITILNLTTFVVFKVSSQWNQLIWYPSGCVEDQSPQEKKENHSSDEYIFFLIKWKVTNVIFGDDKVWTECSSFEAICLCWIKRIL